VKISAIDLEIEDDKMKFEDDKINKSSNKKQEVSF
jgi:hypothetical protein